MVMDVPKRDTKKQEKGRMSLREEEECEKDGILVELFQRE